MSSDIVRAVIVMMVGACHLLWVVVTRGLSLSVAGGYLWPVVVCGLWVLVVGENNYLKLLYYM